MIAPLEGVGPTFEATFRGIHDPSPAGRGAWIGVLADHAHAVYGDLDGDGHVDLVLAGSADGTPGRAGPVVMINQGAGTFADITTGRALWPRDSEMAAAGVDPTAMALADFDGDGLLDLAVAPGSARHDAHVLGPTRVWLQRPRDPAPRPDLRPEGPVDAPLACATDAIELVLANDGKGDAPAFDRARHPGVGRRHGGRRAADPSRADRRGRTPAHDPSRVRPVRRDTVPRTDCRRRGGRGGRSHRGQQHGGGGLRATGPAGSGSLALAAARRADTHPSKGPGERASRRGRTLAEPAAAVIAHIGGENVG